MGKAFADVLDTLLEGAASGPATMPPPGGFGFATQPLMFTVPDAAASHLVTVPRPFAAPMPPPRRPRRLSLRQRAALDTFVALGARIDEDFTREELRAEFRTLALRYHPDRHPGSSDREMAHLTTRFAQLTAAYERLQTVLFSIN
jgi:hypothetical protein